MRFNNHFNLKDKHAFLSASKHAWTNYDEEKLARVFNTANQAQKGTELHDLAAKLIKHGIKQIDNGKTFNAYVNDAIGYRMTPEQPLAYSENAFGTADAISFGVDGRGEDRKLRLRIHDLKTGTGPTSERQLEVYAAFFCLEYQVSPFDFPIELRIYQNDEVKIFDADGDDIMHLMSWIKTADKLINKMKEEAYS